MARRTPVGLSDRQCAIAAKSLALRDPRLAAVIAHTGRCRLTASRTHEPFVSMVRALVSQQLSGKAAATIYARVEALVGGAGGMAPANVIAADPTALRAAGLSRQKISYLVDLSERVSDGRLDLGGLELRSDDDVIEAITAVKGFGRWSAEMFLMFRLNRPDVFPVNDLGIVKGVQKLLGMKRKPSVRTMLRTAEAWRPYRSVAAWFLWRLHELPAETLIKTARRAPAQRRPFR